MGLAPSAASAQVLAEDLGIGTENLAKWWQNHLSGGSWFRDGELVIIDEASLAGTVALDQITSLAAEAGAKVLLVGDFAQLQSVTAGGVFSLLVHDRDDAPELLDVHRFTHEWEKAASLALRQGSSESIDLYNAHGRVRSGTSDSIVDAAYDAWRADCESGRASVLISDSNEAVAAMNIRARCERILDGSVDALQEVALHDGTRTAVGDTVIARRNDRRLRTARSWVRNGDRWTVVGIGRNGSVEVRRTGRRWGNTALLPAEYVKHHVDLGYAVTAHRAQGMTTDSAHVVVASGMTRENLYVAMTRGRESNVAYVALDQPDVAHTGPRPGDNDKTARSILCGVLQHVGAEQSAHEALRAEQNIWGSVAQIAAEYDTIAAAAQHDRWVSAIRGCGLSSDQANSVIDSDAFGPLTAELRRAEAYRFDVDQLLPHVVGSRGFEDAEDITAVIHARVASSIAHDMNRGISRQSPRLIAGLIPRAIGRMNADMQEALVERGRLLEERATVELDSALAAWEAWVRALGPAPRSSAAATWRRHASTVAAYRDRYGIIGGASLGLPPESTAQRLDLRRARAAVEAAKRLAAERQPGSTGGATVSAGVPAGARQF